MVDLPNRADRNNLRQVIQKAEKDQVITREEAGFVIRLVERFRDDREKLSRQANVIQGQIEQLKINERVIVNLIESMVAAAERDIARQETMRKLKEGHEIEAARHAEREAKKEEKPTE